MNAPKVVALKRAHSFGERAAELFRWGPAGGDASDSVWLPPSLSLLPSHHYFFIHEGNAFVSRRSVPIPPIPIPFR